ncbi:hypothetical protein [Caballeronia sp. LZ016]
MERYWSRLAQPRSYDRLLDSIDTKVIPLLERFPAIGRLFLDSMPDNCDALLACEKLIEATGGSTQRAELREHIFDDYVLLYWLGGQTVKLLSIRRSKELSLDFDHIWDPER